MTDALQIRLTIPEGLYKLTEDVTNPKPDRRTRDRRFWLSETFKAGTYLSVRSETMGLDLVREETGKVTRRHYITMPFGHRGTTLRFHTEGGEPRLGRSDMTDEDDMRVNAILPKLERVEPSTLEELQSRYQCEPDNMGSILEFLLVRRLVSFEDVREAMRLRDADANGFWDLINPEDADDA